MFISWTNKGFDIINMHGTTMKIKNCTFFFGLHNCVTMQGTNKQTNKQTNKVRRVFLPEESSLHCCCVHGGAYKNFRGAEVSTLA